jgi:CO/xanthine dehydrogenase Mo-binding subunit
VDLQWLVPLGGFLGVVGGGVAWLINRADKKRDSREAAMIQTLKDYIEELKKKLRWWERRDNRRTRTGDKWRGQLIANQITPVPEDWPEDEDEQ